jgi:hypothetical protein
MAEREQWILDGPGGLTGLDAALSSFTPWRAVNLLLLGCLSSRFLFTSLPYARPPSSPLSHLFALILLGNRLALPYPCLGYGLWGILSKLP